MKGAQKVMELTAKVIELLSTYKDKKRKIEQLRFELANPPGLSDEDIIGSLAYGDNLSDIKVTAGNRISDKTMAIALKYREHGERLMNESLAQIARELDELESETKRIEHYSSLLPEKLRSVIRMFYFENMTNAQIAEKTSITIPAVIYRKNAAIKELTEMFDFLNSVKE